MFILSGITIDYISRSKLRNYRFSVKLSLFKTVMPSQATGFSHLLGRVFLRFGAIVVYRFNPYGYYGYSRIQRTTDQPRTRMGAGTLRRNGDPDSHGLQVYDTRLTADTMTMTPNVTTHDTTN